MPSKISHNASHRLSDLWNAVWQIEQQYDLLNVQINGVYVWPIVRFSVVERLYRECFPGEAKIPVGGTPTVKTLVGTALTLVRQHVTSPWRTSGPYDTILVPFYRKQIHNGHLTEIHSERILNESAFGRLLVLDIGDDANILPSTRNRDVISRDHLWFLALMRGAASVAAYLPGAMRLQKTLAEAFGKKMGIGRSISAFDIALRVAVFAESRSLARKIILKSGAKRLVMLIGRGGSAITAAAQDCGLQTYELQHGMICKYQAAYHYPGRPYVPYAPETILTYGTYWQDAVDFPQNTHTLVVGSSNLELYREKVASRRKYQVFVPSQGAVGAALFKIVIDTARLAPQWQFIFRPHPLEVGRVSEVMRSYSGDLPGNFRVSSQSEDFYDVLVACEVQIGVYSTALFEGMALGVRTIVLDLPGAENMAMVIDSGDAALAHDACEAAALLASAPHCLDPEKYYAPPVRSILETLTGA